MTSLGPSVSIEQRIVRIPPIPNDMEIYTAFTFFSKNPAYTFFPVIDKSLRPQGIIRERSLKEYTYAMFGRELIKRRALSEFVSPCPQFPFNASAGDILSFFASNLNPDGLLMVDNEGGYVGVLLAESLLALYEENRLAINRQLLHTQKMEAIGTLAGGIAHDFNNILMPIMGYTELLLGHVSGDSKDAAYLKQIMQATERARDLVGQILAFSRQRQQERSFFGLRSIIKETLKLLRASLPTTISIGYDFQTEKDTINADPSQIHQILMNLCTNAAYAMRSSGGRLDLTLHAHDGTIRGWAEGTGLADGEYMRLSISDTGSGIDPLILPRIFEPFFTTKPQGEGTGMGLAVVHGIVKSYNGLISVETAIGKGTIFHIHLPVASQPVGETRQDGNHERPSGNGESVMFVDDEPMITEIAEQILSLIGYQVTICNGSLEALTRFNTTPNNYDLVITDLTMPDLTGIELARRMIKVKPSIPIVLCTGYSEKLTAVDVGSFGIAEMLLKPVDFDKLAKVMRRLLA